MIKQKFPLWMDRVLKAAALYNLLFALMTLIAPFWIFDITGATRPNLPELWQCIGMIVGVYGIGYWIASYDPIRHWPVILVGLLGKTFGPLGFAKALWEGVFPIKFGWIIVFNDLIWWVPFFLIVKKALAQITGPDLGSISDNHRLRFSELQEKSKNQPVLILFFRHSGCTFCREMVFQLSKVSQALQSKKAKVVLVHMGQEGESAFHDLVKSAGLPSDWELLADPERAFYQLAGLQKGNLNQLFSLKVIWRGFVAGILKGHGVGPIEGDGFMMPGALVFKEGNLTQTWKPRSASETLPKSLLDF